MEYADQEIDSAPKFSRKKELSVKGKEVYIGYEEKKSLFSFKETRKGFYDSY
jgi:hypothetical protein